MCKMELKGDKKERKGRSLSPKKSSKSSKHKSDRKNILNLRGHSKRLGSSSSCCGGHHRSHISSSCDDIDFIPSSSCHHHHNRHRLNSDSSCSIVRDAQKAADKTIQTEVSRLHKLENGIKNEKKNAKSEANKIVSDAKRSANAR